MTDLRATLGAVGPARSRLIRCLSWALAGLVLLARPAAAQQNRRCLFEVKNIARQGVQIEPAPGVQNFFGGGDVHLKCRGQKVDVFSDSVASYQGKVIQFIGNVKYRDSTSSLDANAGTYFRDGEWFDAQGDVVHTDLKNGSSLTGERIQYYRPIKGTAHEELEIKAENRPTLHYAFKDSTGKVAEPYVIVADRMRIVGSDVIYAWGSVHIDRSDFLGRGDSLWMDNAKRNAGRLMGNASMRSVSKDSFALTGKTIDLKLRNKELTNIRSNGDGDLNTADVRIKADTISIKMENRQVEQTLAWGKTLRPQAFSGDYEIRGDSLAIDTPDQKLKEVRSYRGAWAGFRPDSGSGKRDWIAGGQLTAVFVQRDSAGQPKTQVERIRAVEKAQSYYRMSNDKSKADGRPSINYSRADTIVVAMRTGSDSTGVESIRARGNVDGVQLQPVEIKIKNDSTAADTARARGKPDTVRAKRPPK
ncbi:MAG: hypothetical protein ABI647_04100 [Gemmatimonadota bacterium]